MVGAVVREQIKHPGLAAVLSFFVPGAGQLYNGHVWRFLFWLIITPGLWIGSGGTLGWVCHFISAWTAHSLALRCNREISQQNQIPSAF